jgi:hypothetical protein
MNKLLFYLLVLCLVPFEALARPVSYPGGWTFMTKNDVDLNSVHLHYSPSAFYSVGYRGEYWNSEDYWSHSLAVNNLLKRWNNPASQANLYLKSGVGFAYSDKNDFDNEYDPLAYTGMSVDWEDRRYFIGHEFRFIYADEIDKSFHQTGRVGIAPYVGDYGDVHTWMMVEVGHHPGSDESLTVTPLLRFFKDVYLLEVGVSDRGKFMLNAIIRY